MKRILLAVMTILLLSCSSSDSEEEMVIENIINPSFDTNLLIGAWVNQKVKLNGGQEFLYQHNPNCPKDGFGFFNSEIRPFTYDELIHINDDCGTEGIGLEWRVNRNMLFLYFGESLILSYEVISLTATEFKAETSVDFDNDGSIDDVEITAVKEDPYGWFD